MINTDTVVILRLFVVQIVDLNVIVFSVDIDIVIDLSVFQFCLIVFCLSPDSKMSFSDSIQLYQSQMSSSNLSDKQRSVLDDIKSQNHSREKSPVQIHQFPHEKSERA